MEIPFWLQILGDTILIAACSYCVILGIQELMKYRRIRKAGYLVEGAIIDFTIDDSGDGKTYPAIVSYETIQGEKITATAQSSSGIKPTIGKKVWVVYDPDEPSTFYYKKSSVPFLSMLVIIGFGSGAILTALHLFGKI